MYLKRLLIQGIRNIHSADVALSPRINVFYGANGSGKSSILEAVHLLSRGRSFRTRSLKSLITHGQGNCTCFGNVADEGGRETPVGVSRSENGEFVFKVNGERVGSASSLANELPLQLVNAQSFQLLEGSPGVRRRYLDWGVFHVEHHYRELWTRFQRCLKHRNSLLRHGRIDRLQLTVWDREFCTLSQGIHTVRESYLEKLLPRVKTLLDRFGLPPEISFRYMPGWDLGQDLAEQLDDTLDRDQRQGFSQLGPHRADLRIYIDKSMAGDVLSRGQTKMLIYALKLAQGDVFQRETGHSCIYMLDDLPSELDAMHRDWIGRILLEMGVQVLVTGVYRGDMESLWCGDTAAATLPRAMFHVEQGRIVPETE